MTAPHYPELDANPDFAALEEDILQFWEQQRVFAQSVTARPAKNAQGGSNQYVFYDGPPFANGLPHYGHLLTGFVKDTIARYHTMAGSRVERRFGWDCHGLPAEMGAEKDLGIAGRLAILDYGIGKFNDYCRSSVMKYTAEWEYYVNRQGRWVDFKNDYKTMDTPFMESVIWAFSELYKKDLVFEAFRVMPYSWAAESTLSNFEIRMDNATREREDKAAYVKFKLKEKPAGAPEARNYYIIAWTTTPWTLPSNLALAVSNQVVYGAWSNGEDCYIAGYNAEPKLNEFLCKPGFAPKVELSADAIIGLSYEPLFPYFAGTENAFRVIDGGEAVSDGEGTGVIHMAPGFGEVDQKVCAENGIEVIVPVDNQGKFTDEIYDIPWRPPESADADSTPHERGMEAAAQERGMEAAAQERGMEAAAHALGITKTPIPSSPVHGGSQSEAMRGGVNVATRRDPVALARARAMRIDPTEAEKKLWSVLSDKKLADKKFRRQHAIGSYIVDFACPMANLIIELDGGQHSDQAKYDAARTTFLNSQHYRVLRFWNHEVIENLEGVVASIVQALAHPPESADADSTPRERGMEVAAQERGMEAAAQERGMEEMLSLQGLLVVPDTRIAEADITVSEEDKARHISPKDVHKYGLANMRIVRWLKANGKLVKDEPYKHNYPHCYRTDTPIIYRAMSSWYVAVTKFRDRAVELNRQINWVPGHIRDGQMGHMLATAPDWSISRNRFWGTPIPIWRSDSGKMIVPGSIAEIEKLSGKKVEDLHRPFIDTITFERNGEIYRRVEAVFDCWFESGSMPFAQLHYPFENKERFEQNFPADFITEYVGQTRGWFNTLIMLSTALFDKPPFLNCICHGVVLDAETGLKYSKRLKNYRDPKEVMDGCGADALRWMMLSSPVMRGADISVDAGGKFIRDVVRLNIKPLWSAYNFFTLYANSEVSIQKPEIRFQSSDFSLLDRYILAKAKAAVTQIKTSMDAYDTPGATDAVTAFFDVLNNWYIRRSRTRFWGEAMSADKQAAYDTLFTVLNLMVRAAAPLLPFICEAVYRGLQGCPSGSQELADSSQAGNGTSSEKAGNNASNVIEYPAPAGGGSNPPLERIGGGGKAGHGNESVHLADFPDVRAMADDIELVADMDRVRDACTAMGAIRNTENIRNRQPLASATLYGAGASRLKPFSALMEDELNVKEIRFADSLQGVAEYTLTIDFKIAGKRLGPKMKAVGAAAKAGDWTRDGEKIIVGGEPMEVDEYHLQLKPLVTKGAQPLSGNDALVVLDLTITPELEAEGRARDLVRMIQQARKDSGLHVADRIALALDVPREYQAAIDAHGDYIREQTLAMSLGFGSSGAAMQVRQELDGTQFVIGLSKVA